MASISLGNIYLDPYASANYITVSNILTLLNTSNSVSSLTGSLVSYGGIGILNSQDAVSSLNGGSLTVSGGVAVNKSIFTGANLTLSNATGIFSVMGTGSQSRFQVNTSSVTVAPDGVNQSIIFNPTFSQTNFPITITSSNTNSLHIETSSGSSSFMNFNPNSGINIKNILANLTLGDNTSQNSFPTIYLKANGSNQTDTTIQATGGNSSNNQGKLQLLSRGGLEIRGSGANVSTLRLLRDDNNNYTQNSLIDFTGLDSASNIQSCAQITASYDSTATLTSSPGTISFLTTPIGSLIPQTRLTIANTGNVTILNNTSISGITFLNNTTDATSTTSTTSLNILGGLSVNKKVYIGDSIGTDIFNNSKNNKIVLYQSSGLLTESNQFVGLGVNLNSLRFQVDSSASDFIYYTGTTSGSSSEIFRVKGNNTVQFGGSLQKYWLIGGGDISSSFSLQGQLPANATSFNIYSSDGDSTDNVNLQIFGRGLPNSVTNSERLYLGWNKLTNQYQLDVSNFGTGTARNLSIQVGISNQLLLKTDGTISINSTQNSSSIISGGALTISGGTSIAKDLYVGGNIYNNSGSLNLNTLNLNGTINSSSNSVGTLTSSGGISISNTADAISNVNGGTFTSAGGFAVAKKAFVGVNLSVATNNFGYPLRLGYNSSSYQIAFENSSGIVNMGIGSLSTNDLLIENTGGNINLNYNNNLNINQIGTNFVNFASKIITINSTIPSTSNSTGSLILNGGIAINNTNDSTSLGSGGSLTSSGGFSFAKSGAIGTNLSIGSWNFISSSGIFSTTAASLSFIIKPTSHFTIQNSASNNTILDVDTVNQSVIFNSTAISTSNTNGAIVSYGGISINNSASATSSVYGGSLTSSGGFAFNQNGYLGTSLDIGTRITTHNAGNGNSHWNLQDATNTYFSINLSNVIAGGSGADLDFRANGSVSALLISRINGNITVSSTTTSTSAQNGALILQNGGLSINNNQNATSITSGGSFTTNGGIAVYQDSYFNGKMYLSNTTISAGTNTGALIVNGGIGLGGNLNVGGSAIINGNLTINGTMTAINSTITTLNSNILVLDNGPSGSYDSGVLVQRYQTDNNLGTGNVVNDTPAFSDVLPLQSAANSSQVVLSSSANNTVNYYVGWYIKITSGFSSNQVRKIIAYTGGSRLATLSSAWTTQNPAMNDSFSLYNKPFTGIIFNETLDRFQLGSTIADPGQASVNFTDSVDLQLRNLFIVATNPSVSASSGGIVTNGGISVNNTNNATSLTSGGSITVSGGLSVAKTIYAQNINVNGVNLTPPSNDIGLTTFSGLNNVSSYSNITGLAFPSTVNGIDIYISVKILATGNLYGNYHLSGINKGTTYQMSESYVGDTGTGINFQITNSGQVQYVSGNYTGFTSLSFSFRAITT